MTESFFYQKFVYRKNKMRKKYKGPKNSRLSMRITKKVAEDTSEEWKMKTYYDEYGNKCSFVSKTHYVEYCLNLINNMSEMAFKITQRVKCC